MSAQARGAGLGKALIESALAFCEDQDYEKVILWTVRGLAASKSLYERHGLVLIEEIEHELWGKMQ